ncbi:MAG: rhomboid family intramembrane serine protease [Gemmatimonadota bacterium]|nr:rhomboid family intramembrane serine protease [Gemmatimonadota bacterium]
MRYTSQPPSYGSAGPRLRVTPWVKILLMANAGVFLVTVLVGQGEMFDLFAFSPDRLLARPWGMVTYMFMHAGLWHLLMNLLFIFFFGPPLEERWGSDLFLKFYLVCGLGGVLLSFAFSDAVIVGASAACYGIMLAFALAWPNQTVYVWALFPVKVKWLVGFLVALSFVSAIGANRDGVAHLAHLGGAVAGFLMVKSGWMPSYSGSRYAGKGDWGPGAGGAGKSERGGRKRRGTDWRKLARMLGVTPAGPKLWKDEEKSRRTTRSVRDPRDVAAMRVIEEHMAEERARRELDQVDEVLDKISAQGINSLTEEERELLERVSRQTQLN